MNDSVLSIKTHDTLGIFIGMQFPLDLPSRGPARVWRRLWGRPYGHLRASVMSIQLLTRTQFVDPTAENYLWNAALFCCRMVWKYIVWVEVLCWIDRV